MNSLLDIIKGGKQLPWQQPGYDAPQTQQPAQQQGDSPWAALAQSIPYLSYGGDINQYGKPAGNIASAMTDMHNPLYQQLYGQFQQQGEHNLAQTIAQLSGQNRKLSMMGRASLLDPERGGEQIFRGLTQGHQDVQDRASTNAFAQLSNAYKPAQAQGLWDQQNAHQKTDATSGIMGVIAKLIGL